MRTLILAAGTKDNWNGALGTTKHMIPLRDDEPLIHNTQRRLHDLGVTDIHVVCQPERSHYVVPPSVRGEPQDIPREFVHEQEQSRNLWHPTDKTMILYGDTYYSDGILKTMVDDQAREWKVYARHGASKYTGKKYGEMFGWVFRPEHHDTLDGARNVAIAYKENGLWWRCLGWELYRIAMKRVPWEHYKEAVHFVEWDDATDDFDALSDWERWSKLFPRLAN